MKEPLISVIVPVYKVEKYLERCVKSIVDQTYKNFEIILVDDGSPDRCPAMCDAWAVKDSRIQVVHKENGGLSDARNAGMEISSGELIGFVDSDDWIAPDMYQRLYAAMKGDNSDIAACGVEIVWEDGTPSRRLTKTGSSTLSREEGMRAIIEESWLKHPVWYKLYRADIIRDIKFPVGKYHEDVFWSYQAVGNAKRISVIDDIGYYYWQRSGSIMGESYSVKRLDEIEALEDRQAYLENNFPELASTARCRLWFSCMYHGQKALRKIPKKEQISAMEYLSGVIRRHPFSAASLNGLGRKERIWIGIAKISLKSACRIRNAFRIGL